MNPDGFLPDGTPVYFKTTRGVGNTALQLQMYASLMEQRDPNVCVDCEYYGLNLRYDTYVCIMGHDDIVGRHREACKDFKEDEYVLHGTRN